MLLLHFLVSLFMWRKNEINIYLLDSIITIYLWIIIINAILSWLVAFNILNTQNRFVFSST